MDDFDSMKEMKEQGYGCSQIMLKLGLEMLGKDDPDLVRAVQGLAGGLGYTGDVCGVLSSASCLLGLYAGKGQPEDEDDPRLLFMIEELVNWFKQEYGQVYGGIHCEDIIDHRSSNTPVQCPQITMATYQKVKELLVENGFDLSGTD